MMIGYYPVFSFLSSINGMIDLASVGLIGQKGMAMYSDQNDKRKALTVLSWLLHTH